MIDHHLRGRQPTVRPVGEAGPQPVEVAAVRVQGEHADPIPPGLALAGKPTGNGCPTTVFDHVEEPPGAQVDEPGDEQSVMGGVAGQEHRLIGAQPRHAGGPGRVVHQSVPWSTTADMTVAQPTPMDRATCATESTSCPTRRHASARARSVMLIRAPIASLVSVHVATGHRASRHRHTRFTHTRVTGRPAQGRSRTHDGRRAMRLGLHPAAVTEHLHLGRLDRPLELTGVVRHGQQAEPGQPEHRRRSTTVVMHPGTSTDQGTRHP